MLEDIINVNVLILRSWKITSRLNCNCFALLPVHGNTAWLGVSQRTLIVWNSNFSNFFLKKVFIRYKTGWVSPGSKVFEAIVEEGYETGGKRGEEGNYCLKSCRHGVIIQHFKFSVNSFVVGLLRKGTQRLSMGSGLVTSFQRKRITPFISHKRSKGLLTSSDMRTIQQT